jgi:hypothetical protein
MSQWPATTMFDWFKKKKAQAPRAPEIRDTLFGDMPLEQWPPGGPGAASGEPWTSFVSVRRRLEGNDKAGAITLLRDIAGRRELEARHTLQAWHFLRELGVAPEPAIAKQVLGVVVEVGLPEGLDLLAAYADHSARYFNHGGGAVIWEAPDASLTPLIQQLLGAGERVANAIGPWEQPRPPAPPEGHARLSMLTPSGLHFGQAPFNVLASDGMAGPLLMLATQLMQQLIEKSQSRRG